jgi:hypothetical protein
MTSGARWPQTEQTGSRRQTSMIVREVTLLISSQKSKANAIEGTDESHAIFALLSEQEQPHSSTSTVHLKRF